MATSTELQQNQQTLANPCTEEKYVMLSQRFLDRNKQDEQTLANPHKVDKSVMWSQCLLQLSCNRISKD